MPRSISQSLLKQGLVLCRMGRSDEKAWQSAKSWLGGRPRMDPHNWPRDQYMDAPLHHLAHIDLSDIPAGPWSSLLPETGALSFFTDTSCDDMDLPCSVVYTRDPEQETLTDPPADCPPIGGIDWMFEDLHRSALNEQDARRLLMRWPVEFVNVQFEALDGFENVTLIPSLDEVFGPPVPSLPIFQDPKYESDGDGFSPVDDGIFPWDVARRLVRQCHQRDVGQEFREEWTSRLSGKDLYQPMGKEVAQQLQQDAHQVSRNAKLGINYGSGTSIVREAASEAYIEMMVGSREVYDRIPTEIRQYLETQRKRSAWSASARHQVFGTGLNIQGQAEERADEVLLFQAASDDMLMWIWGDVGTIQFWITPENLAQQNWASVEATFEGG